jgi:hypothetical protein
MPCTPHPSTRAQRHELVFSEPHESWYAGVCAQTMPRPMPRKSQVEGWLPSAQDLAAAEAAELAAIQAARAKVAQISASYRRQLALGDPMAMG